MVPTGEHSKKLTYLQVLLDHLPDSIPFCDIKSTVYNFSVTEDDVIDFGDENSAINHILEISFGEWSRTNGVIPIKEKGPGIVSVVDVLQRCLTRDSNDARFILWLENLSKSVEEVYRSAGKKVSDQISLPIFNVHHSSNKKLPDAQAMVVKAVKRKFNVEAQAVGDDEELSVSPCGNENNGRLTGPTGWSVPQRSYQRYQDQEHNWAKATQRHFPAFNYVHPSQNWKIVLAM